MKILYRIALTLIGVAVTGCTVHPAGEHQERQSAERQGAAFTQPIEDRQLPALSPEPTSEELIRYALLASPELEQKYWEWRSAIEQIPQDGTQPSNLVLSAGIPITHGSASFDRTTVTVANDPMADLVWPTKLTTAAQRALDNAKAAGFRFQKAKFELRQKVLNAYYDHALATELLRLDKSDLQIMTTAANVVESGIASGRITQTDIIKARNDIDLLMNQITEEEARLPALKAALNSTIGRDPTTTLMPATALSEHAEFTPDQRQLVAQAIEHNPDLASSDSQLAGQNESITFAKLQYQPDFALSAGSDLAGDMQSLLGMITVPYLRYEAINAQIAQAEANLHSAEAARRQTMNDLQTRVITDIVTLEGIHKQIDLVDSQILPRSHQNLDLIRSSYESGHATMADIFDAERSLVAIKRIEFELKVVRGRQQADVEATIAAGIEPGE